jgi:hypothetical protein
MRNFKKPAAIILCLGLLALAVPALAQLGSTDVSSFTVQNVDVDPGTVTIVFVDEAGTQYQPATLNAGQTNPFILDPGEAFEVYVPGIPSGLPDGRYAVVISSNKEIVGIANLIGEGATYFNGSYSGFQDGATTFYLPAVVHNFYGWYSLISVQNIGNNATNITVDITCEDGTTGQYTQAAVPAKASVHFDLEDTSPTGFTGATECNGSALIASGGEKIVVVDNQRAPASGNTQSYSGIQTGAQDLYAPALYTDYFGWNASVNIRKIGSGNTDVTVTYSDAGTSTCNLTDSVPSCLLYMPTEHASAGTFGATLSSSSLDILAVVNAANGSQAQTYNATATGTDEIGIPSVMKTYFGWNSSVTCQNVGSSASSLNVSYNGYEGDAYDTASLDPGDTVEIYIPAESFLPDAHQGGMSISGNTSGAEITCIVNFNNSGQMASTDGDWSMSYNAFNQ